MDEEYRKTIKDMLMIQLEDKKRQMGTYTGDSKYYKKLLEEYNTLNEDMKQIES